MSKLPPLKPELAPVYLCLGRKSHPQEKKDQRNTEREQREGTLAFARERIAREGRGTLSTVPWLFDAKTGLTDQRPAYQARLREARTLRAEGRRVYLVIRQLDRLGRDAEELHRCYKEFVALDVTLLAVNMGGEIAPEVFPHLVANAQVGSILIANNVRRVNNQIRRDGWWRPGRVPWGYQRVGTTAEQQRQGAPAVTLALHPDESEAVRAAFQAVADGQSVSRVAAGLGNLAGVQLGGHEGRDGFQARRITRQDLRGILRSPIYAGRQPDGSPGNWAPIVDGPLWDAVQARLANVRTAPPQQASGEYLLTGLLWCPECEARGVASRMVGGKPHGGDQAPRYRCSACWRGSAVPQPCYYSLVASAAEADVRRQVAPLLAGAAGDPRFRRDVREALSGLLAEAQSPQTAIAERLAAVDAEIATVQARADVLMDRLERGVITDAEFTRRMAPHRAAEEKLTIRREAIAAEAPPVPAGVTDSPLTVKDVMGLLDRLGAQWAEDTSAAQRPVLAQLVRRIVPRRSTIRGVVDCTLDWTEHGARLAQAAARLGLTACPVQQVVGNGQGEAAAG